MAIYRTGLAGLRASGKLGGIVFRPIETQGVLSAKRSGLRGDDRLVGLDLEAHKAASEAWVENSEANRDAWDQMADAYQTGFGFDEPSNQSGHGLFLRTARSLLAASGPFPPTFPLFQVQGRRQAIPLLFPDEANSNWSLRWAPGLSGRWLPASVWLRLRATVVTRPSVKRPPRTFVRSFQVLADDVPLSPFDPPATLGGFGFERDRGWMRWEFVSWDRWGWFSPAREIIYPVLPSSAVWFLAIGPTSQGEPNARVVYDPPEIKVTWSNESVDFEATETVGPGGLVTVGDVASWIDGSTFLRVQPDSILTHTGDASSLERIPGAVTNIRGNPVLFEFSGL